ncbi:MAG: VCBS repeat-containing protein [Spirochaetes bacterium]|nr:VCBS repeat-containing protein [Spirochaetota bacterium]
MKHFVIIFILIFSVSNLMARDNWEEIDTDFEDRKEGEFPTLSTIDIDGDGDLDIFIGNWDGYLAFYRNMANKKGEFEYEMEYSGTSIKSSFQEVSTFNAAVPFWIDIDSDGDYDLFLGNLKGTLTFYENTGTPSQPKLKLKNKGYSKQDSYSGIDVGYNSVPVFVDIDGDNDYDLFMGERDGYINYYENKGDPHNAVFRPIDFADSMNHSFNGIDVGECSFPFLIDIDHDNDNDLFIGNWEGYLFFYRNDGTQFDMFFKEINYAVSPQTSFNKYRSEGDCRFSISRYVKNYFDFVFCKINGDITWYRTNDEFNQMFKKQPRVDVTLKMANYYYEMAKEKYLDGEFIESRLILEKAKKYKEIKKMDLLEENLNKEIKTRVNNIIVGIKDDFNKGNFVEALDNLQKGKFMRASVLFDQIKKNYGSFKYLEKYRSLAQKYEKDRKKIIMAEKYDDNAIDFFKKGDYKKALSDWERASKLIPEDYTIVENIIMCKAKMDEIETKAIINKLLHQARDYLKKGEKDKAFKIYSRLMELGPVPEKVQKDINSLKGDIMEYKQKEYKEKINRLYKNGLEYFEKGEYEKAIEHFKKVVFYNSDHKEAWQKLKEAEKKFLEKEKLE